MRALLLLFFGLLLPSFTVAFEFFTHMCRDGLFDPLPTAWDVLFCLSLPAATVALAFGCRCGPLCGFALAICAVYAAVLLPLTPFAFLAIAYFGLGLLPLCPLLGFLVLAWASQGQPGRGKGFALALVALTVLHSPVDRLLLELARTTRFRTAGEDGLRHHDLTPLAAMAAGRPSPRGVDVVSVLLSWLGPVPMGEARDVYFHVTGQPFSEVAGAETWVADHDMASDRIGTRRNGLILSRSEWKGQTWDLTFQEGAYGDEEVRALIHLPPGGVVSGATLWVKGKPIAAKFTSPVRAESAYRSTVLAARDPLVISWAGPDRVLLKVYPVSHLGQHVRLQIEGGKGQPWFEEANFSHPSVPPSCSVDRCGPPLRDEIVVVDGSAAWPPTATS